MDEQEKYDDCIFDNDKRINYKVTYQEILPNGGLKYYCSFFDEQGTNIGGYMGYIKCEEDWQPISRKLIKKLYFEHK